MEVKAQHPLPPPPVFLFQGKVPGVAVFLSSNSFGFSSPEHTAFSNLVSIFTPRCHFSSAGNGLREIIQFISDPALISRLVSLCCM